MGKILKLLQKVNQGIQLSSTPLLKIKSYVFVTILIYIEKTQEYHKKESQLLLSAIEPHEAISTSTVSHWIIEVLGLAGIDTKTFTAQSTRSASSPTEEILKRAH